METLGELDRLRTFVRAAVVARGGIADDLTTTRFAIRLPDGRQWSLTVDREEALADETLQLLGLEHPMVAEFLGAEAELEARRRALLFDDGNASRPENVQAIWEVQIQTGSLPPGATYSAKLLAWVESAGS